MSKSISKKKHPVPVLGIVLIYLGTLLILQNFNFIPWGIWNTLWKLWPVLLIVSGVNIIVGRFSSTLSTILIVAILAATLRLAIWQYEETA